MKKSGTVIAALSFSIDPVHWTGLKSVHEKLESPRALPVARTFLGTAPAVLTATPGNPFLTSASAARNHPLLKSSEVSPMPVASGARRAEVTSARTLANSCVTPGSVPRARCGVRRWIALQVLPRNNNHDVRVCVCVCAFYCTFLLLHHVRPVSVLQFNNNKLLN